MKEDIKIPTNQKTHQKLKEMNTPTNSKATTTNFPKHNHNKNRSKRKKKGKYTK